MDMIKLGYSVPEPLHRCLRSLGDSVGVSLQQMTAAGMFYVLNLPGSDRDRLMRAMQRWLEAGGAFSPSDEVPIPPQYRVGPGQPSGAEKPEPELADRVAEAIQEARLDQSQSPPRTARRRPG